MTRLKTSAENSAVPEPFWERWITNRYVRPLESALEALTPAQQQAVRRQAALGVVQTLLLAIILVQVIFTGAMRLLPPETRAALAFLHRIEWAVYLTILLIAAQVIVSWREVVVLTNRIGLLAYRLGRPRLLRGQSARMAQGVYLVLLVVLVAASIWVRINGFIVQPTR